MKNYSKLQRFPLGSITPSGFLKEQLIRSKNGMGGHLYELEPEMIADPYVNKRRVERWSDDDQSGWGAEISGNYWSGFIQLAFTLNDEALIKRATQWVDDMLKNQREDGYLGTYYEPDAKIFEDFNAWGTTCSMRGLLAFYEATQRKDVLNAVYRCMLWFCKNWSGDKKTSYAGPYIIEPMVFCYYHTGDQRLIDFCEDYERYLCENDIFSTSYKAFLNNRLEYNSNHTAGYGTQIRLPALIYSATGKKEYLNASERVVRQIREKANHITGSPISVNEYLAPVSSVAETEYCSYAYFNQTYSHMSCITGEAKYGDYMEELFYNGAQGARKKDEKAIAYLSAPNQIYATNKSSSAYNDMQVYSPCYPTSCCPVNSVALLPEFVRGMILNDEYGNVYMTAYGPCKLRHGGIEIEENTLYPFRNMVEFTFKCDKDFSVFLKIPHWSRGETIFLNGESIQPKSIKNGYAEINRAWHNGDLLSVTFESEIEVLRIDDSDCGKKYPVALRRGVLVYSLYIEGNWVPYDPTGKLPEGWSWFKVKPVFEEAPNPDFHEQLGLRKFMTPWNIALDENLSPDDVTFEELEPKGYVWEVPITRLKLTGYRAPYLCAPYPDRTFEPFGDRQPVDLKKQIELVPYGCTNLRITYFPRADLGNFTDK